MDGFIFFLRENRKKKHLESIEGPAREKSATRRVSPGPTNENPRLSTLSHLNWAGQLKSEKLDYFLNLSTIQRLAK